MRTCTENVVVEFLKTEKFNLSKVEDFNNKGLP